jgi:hypothetical protein
LYERSDDAEQFVQNLAMFLTSFLGAHLKVIEAGGNREFLLNAHAYLIRVSQVKDREIFKVCLEYWNKLVRSSFGVALSQDQHLRYFSRLRNFTTKFSKFQMSKSLFSTWAGDLQGCNLLLPITLSANTFMLKSCQACVLS